MMQDARLTWTSATACVHGLGLNAILEMGFERVTRIGRKEVDKRELRCGVGRGACVTIPQPSSRPKLSLLAPPIRHRR